MAKIKTTGHISYSWKVQGLERLVETLATVTANVDKEMRVITGKTATKTKKWIAKDIQKNFGFNTTQKKLLTLIKKEKKGLTAHKVTLPHERRLPLRDFAARQIKTGVSYKLDSRKGRELAPGAFQGPKPGVMKVSWKGRVFKRTTKKRLPIVQLHGASPWGIFTKRKRLDAAVYMAGQFMGEEAAKRYRWLKLKQSRSF